MAATFRFFFLFSLTLISSHFTTIHGIFSQKIHIELPTEKVTHLHFFFHETLQGENPTAVRIINNPSSSFGTSFMMDSPLTEEVELISKPVGRAQGMYGLASREDQAMVMLINFVFSEGEYAGSTLSMIGRDPVQDTVREMPIVGGTGVFRVAKGYAIAKSLWEISSQEDFIVEFDITVFHT